MESYRNGSGRKLEFGEIRRHRGGRKRNREAEGRRQQEGQTKITRLRVRRLKIAISIYSLVRDSKPGHCAREDSQSRVRESGSSYLVFGKSAISSLRPCYVWKFRGFLCLVFFVISLLCNHNKILQGTEGNSSITPLSSSLSVALELNGYFE